MPALTHRCRHGCRAVVECQKVSTQTCTARHILECLGKAVLADTKLGSLPQKQLAARAQAQRQALSQTVSVGECYKMQGTAGFIQSSRGLEPVGTGKLSCLLRKTPHLAKKLIP